MGRLRSDLGPIKIGTHPPSQPLIEREKAGVAHTTTLFNIMTLLTLVKSNTGSQED